MPQRNSECMNFSVKFELRVFPKSMPLSQPMDRVYSCFDLTHSKVASTTLSVRESKSWQAL